MGVGMKSRAMTLHTIKEMLKCDAIPQTYYKVKQGLNIALNLRNWFEDLMNEELTTDNCNCVPVRKCFTNPQVELELVKFYFEWWHEFMDIYKYVEECVDNKNIDHKFIALYKDVITAIIFHLIHTLDIDKDEVYDFLLNSIITPFGQDSKVIMKVLERHYYDNELSPDLFIEKIKKMWNGKIRYSGLIETDFIHDFYCKYYGDNMRDNE